jgi:hypothetical protein
MSRFWITCLAVAGLGPWSAGCGGANDGDVGPNEGYVCGSDGQTYSLEEADRDGPEVRHRGRCDEPMHCESPTDCFVGDECMSDPDTKWCIPGPTRCNCPGVFEPVCGGDGRNYVNACEAACAGVGTRHEGFCDEAPGEGCMRAGCSDHLCVEEGMDIASTCEWRPVYECYQQATCERQENGQCGFTPTHELVECLERHGEGMCRVDPRWQDGFQAECESPQVPGIVGVIDVRPDEVIRLGEWFGASFQLLEPPVFGDVYSGEGVLVCEGEETHFQGVAIMTPLGELEFFCRVLPETQPGECLDDNGCPVGRICEAGACESCICVDIYMPVCGVDGRTYGNGCEARCAHVPVAYEGECKNDCPVETHVVNFQGECVPKCYGPEQCGDEQHCNAPDVCLQDPACPECDVCVGWCVPPAGDCRTNGCAAGWTCDYCQTADGSAEWICLPPNAGACQPPDECRPTGCNGEICANQDVASPCVALPELACYQELGICEIQPWGQCGWTDTPELDECLSQFDCRAEGCGEGDYCTFCWFSWECIPEGAVC